MKNMLKFTALLLAFLWIFSLAGCNGNTPPVQDDAGKMPDGAGQADNQTPEIDQTDVDSEIFFKTPENAVNFVSLAVGEDADVYAATYEGTVSRYTPEGELVREYPGTEFVCALQYTNKELAIAYLEAAAEDVLSSMKQPNFTLKDLSSYEGYYDMTIPVYHDIYELFKNGGTYSICLPHRERMNIIYEYQHGNLTLDEAIAEIQRKAEFMAGE